MTIGYVVKRYPRYSETFIVNEILAHEAAGLDIRIYALLPPEDTHFQDIIARVRAPVTYLTSAVYKASEFWASLATSGARNPAVWPALADGVDATAREISQAVALADEIQRHGITHLHAHFATSATTVARLAAAMTGVGYSFTAHAKDIFHEATDFGDLRRKFDQAVAGITISRYNLDYLRRDLGIDPDRIRFIYNGLDLGAFPYRAPDPDAREVLAIGRLVEKKGFEYLIDACRLLADRGERVTCRIIGAGALEQSLRERIATLGLTSSVHLCGPLPQAEIKQALRDAALFVAPCVVGADGNRDGLPTVLLEAMALGTPCISTDVTGIPEIITDGDTGLLVGQADPQALGDALSRLLADPPLRARLAHNARRVIERDFDIRRNTARQRALFGTAPQRQIKQQEDAA